MDRIHSVRIFNNSIIYRANFESFYSSISLLMPHITKLFGDKARHLAYCRTHIEVQPLTEGSQVGSPEATVWLTAKLLHSRRHAVSLRTSPRMTSANSQSPPGRGHQ